MKIWPLLGCLIPLFAEAKDAPELLQTHDDDDAVNLLQASAVKNHVAGTAKPDTAVAPGSGGYTVFQDSTPPNPKLVQNDGAHCLKLWGGKFVASSWSAHYCTTQDLTTACKQSPYFVSLVEQCCPGACTNSSEMNPAKWTMESNTEEEARCLLRYSHSYHVSNGFKHHSRVEGFTSKYVFQTCDMIITGEPGWFDANDARRSREQIPPKPNLRKLDGTWVYESCWNNPILQECCPKQCANSQKTPEMPGPPGFDMSLYQDPPEWKSPDYDYYMPVGTSGKWDAFTPKRFEWKGDVCWYSSREAYNDADGDYGLLGIWRDMYGNKQAGKNPRYFWAGGIRCEDIPLNSELGYRELFHSVDQDVNATDWFPKQYAEMWSMCGNTVIAQCCPAICGFTTCGLADVGGAGNPPIECKTQKRFDTPSRKYVDLPRPPWDGQYGDPDTSIMEVGPGTPTPAPGVQPKPAPSPPPAPSPGQIEDGECHGT